MIPPGGVSPLSAPTVASLCGQLGGDLAPVAGFTAPAIEISAVHISELLDPTGYLNGGELLLTTGLALPRDRRGCDDYVRRLKEAGVSALAIGLGPVHSIPPMVLVAACRRGDLTLLEVPGPTPFQIITKAYWGAVARATEQRLNDVLAAYRALVDAAASADPAAGILRTLAREMNGWAALLDPHGRIDHVHPLGMMADAELVLGEISRLQVAGVRSAASFDAGRHVVVVFPLAVEERIVGYLAVGSPRNLDGPQRRVVLTGCALLSIDAVLRQRTETARDATRRCIAILVDMGMTDAARRLAAEVDSPLLGNECLILVVRSRDIEAAGVLVRQWCDRALAVRVDPSVGWFLLPTNHSPLVQLKRSIRAGDPTTAAILSEPIRLEACGAVRIRLIDSLDGLVPGEIILGSPSPRRHRAALARGLDDLVRDGPAELAEALAGYLRRRGNWEHASRDLGVHRNTLRHRIGRCRSILRVDLDDPDIGAELWLLMRERGIASDVALLKPQ